VTVKPSVGIRSQKSAGDFSVMKVIQSDGVEALEDTGEDENSRKAALRVE